MGDIPGRVNLFPGYHFYEARPTAEPDAIPPQRDLKKTPRKPSISHVLLDETPAPDQFLQ